jgi:hypothetical protein
MIPSPYLTLDRRPNERAGAALFKNVLYHAIVAAFPRPHQLLVKLNER